MKRAVVLSLMVLVLAGGSAAETGVKKIKPLPHDYGSIVLNNFSEKAGMAPVVFEHWLHRSKFTCRLCHVDIAFGMKAGSTKMRSSDMRSGYYCGACHNGKVLFGETAVFDACGKMNGDDKRCARCHAAGRKAERKYDFAAFTEGFPRERFGNGINWERAESDGYIHPADFLEGVSLKRPSLAVQKDFQLNAKLGGMPDIVFSHKKHTVWNGCELCHPEIFIGVKKGLTKYSMVDIYEGKFCGVCHNTVAFPVLDCQRCHSKPVPAGT